MSSQAQVREVFSLPKKEVIFDDFGCAYQKGILHTGRMYITENYICFYSSLMGITQKVIIPLNDVTKITKARSLGILKAIRIYKTGKAKPYQFQSFNDCDKTYSIITKLWSNVSPNGKEERGDSTEDEGDLMSIAGRESITTTQNVEKSIRQSEIVTDGVPQIIVTDNQMRLSNAIPEGPQIEDKKEDSETLQQLDQSRDISMIQGNQLAKSMILPPSQNNLESTSTGQLAIEKAQGLTEIMANNSSPRKTDNKEQGGTNPYEYITQQELEKLLEQVPLPENYNEMATICLNMSVKDFFNEIAQHAGAHSLEKFYHDHGEQKITAQDWKVPDPAEEYDGRPVIQATQMFAEIQVKDNPFVKVSPTTKYIKLLENTDTKVQIKVLSKCSGVPYADTFAVEEEWIALQPSPQCSFCVLRFSIQVIFYKSTIFKSKIVSNTLKGCKDFFTEFTDWMKKRGIQFKEKKNPQPNNTGGKMLKHGIEKSNKIYEKSRRGSESDKKVEEVLDNKQKALKYLQIGKEKGYEFRIEIMLAIIILFLFNIYLKVCSIETYLQDKSIASILDLHKQ